jgi:glycosyltransferase involved in cell wall biosynthesis
MSCGTPVIAWPHGSVPEIVEHGVSGFLVDSIEEAVTAVRHISRIDRRKVRSRFDERFTASRMAHDYLAVYRALGRSRAIRVV